MNQKQNHALELLRLITSSERGKLRNIQGILGLTSYQPPYTLRPEFWEEEWCSGWKWQISESFAECMDISLRPYLEPKLDENGDRIPLRNEDGSIKLTPKTKKPVYATIRKLRWAQGGNFCFSDGCVLYNKRIPSGESWGETLKKEISVIKIIKALPVQYNQQSEEIEKLGEGDMIDKSSRFPGYIEAAIYESYGHGLVHIGNFKTSQDDLIKILITGDMSDIHIYNSYNH